MLKNLLGKEETSAEKRPVQKLSAKTWNNAVEEEADGSTKLDFVECNTVDDPAVEDTFRKSLSQYAIDCFESDAMAAIGQDVVIDKIEYIPSYYVNVETQWESRTLVRQAAPTSDKARAASSTEVSDLWTAASVDSSVLGTSNQVSKRLEESYEVTECSWCLATGRHTCSHCDGAMTMTCSSCDGKGQTACSSCKGTTWAKCGMLQHAASVNRLGKGKQIPCQHCAGQLRRKDVKCTKCGTGYFPCKPCGSQGQVRCATCDSNGLQTCSSCNGLTHQGTWLSVYADTCSDHSREQIINPRLSPEHHEFHLKQTSDPELSITRTTLEGGIELDVIESLAKKTLEMTKAGLDGRPSPNVSGTVESQVHKPTAQCVGIEVNPAYQISYTYDERAFTAALIGASSALKLDSDPLSELNRLVEKALQFSPITAFKSKDKTPANFINLYLAFVPYVGFMQIKDGKELLEKLKEAKIQRGQREIQHGIYFRYYAQGMAVFGIIAMIGMMLFG